MFKQGSLESPTLENSQITSLLAEELNFIAENKDISSQIKSSEVETVSYTRLNLETLRCFEVVDQQYANSGVIFDNCMAIHPSNPAFPTTSGNIVLLGAPTSGFINIRFLQPVRGVIAYVTSSQRLVMSAYNRDRVQVAETILPGANLANSNSVVPPNHMVKVKAKEIYHVTFSVFNGQFTVDEFSFCVDDS